jgi:hypothetical protein
MCLSLSPKINRSRVGVGGRFKIHMYSAIAHGPSKVRMHSMYLQYSACTHLLRLEAFARGETQGRPGSSLAPRLGRHAYFSLLKKE